jgi:diguanylate cyclase (GGDEF)-like protein/PAS domain S-box-containing protein
MVNPLTAVAPVADVPEVDSDHDVTRMQEHFRAIVEGSDDAIISKTTDGLVTSWNAGAQKIFGFSAHEMLGKPLLVLFPQERIAEENYLLQQVLSGNKVSHFETERLHKSGKRINVSVTLSPIRDSRGVVIGASKIARDITLQKAAEIQLRLTSQVFTSTSEGILITDREGRIVDANTAFSRITGYGRDEVLGWSPQKFSSSRQSPSTFRRMRLALARYGEWKGEIWSRRKDGESYSVLLTASRVCDTGGIVSNFVVLLSDITPLKIQQEQLERIAHFDALTNLPNRLLLSDRLKQAMLNCTRRQQMLAVLYMDIDGFKFVNDSYGHGVGDSLLVSLSNQMRAVLREGDTLARMGGDEFVVVLTDLDTIQDCLPLLQRVLAACAQTVELNGNRLSVTISIGVTFYPDDDVDADQLLRNADNAMYEAKRSGKNGFRIFDTAQHFKFKNTNGLLARIEQALLRHEFVLHFQPKVNMRTGAVVGAEALIRWQHPERGLLAPAEFLPVIEDHLLAVGIGEWVIDAALTQMAVWRAAGLDLPVSVNIGARQLQQGNFVQRLQSILAQHAPIDPSRLELEVLETSALSNIAQVAQVIADCAHIGVQFALDDFGTGYSSLTYLRRLPVAKLKIDQSFVRDMLGDADDLAILEGIIGLAAAFSRDVIAEGVETVAHGTMLLRMGCEMAQGYGIARPMPGDQMPAWAATWRPDAAWLAPPDAHEVHR